MFRCFMQWLNKQFDVWTGPWNKAQDLEFREWAYRRGLNIKTDVKD
ncbi:MAG TPA: hypothetical protein VFD02_01555 [Syntrophomonadaceae bacterium]|nr:hypothetical protein [Syntrophomonadaceae bacterium]